MFLLSFFVCLFSLFHQLTHIIGKHANVCRFFLLFTRSPSFATPSDKHIRSFSFRFVAYVIEYFNSFLDLYTFVQKASRSFKYFRSYDCCRLWTFSVWSFHVYAWCMSIAREEKTGDKVAYFNNTNFIHNYYFNAPLKFAVTAKRQHMQIVWILWIDRCYLNVWQFKAGAMNLPYRVHSCKRLVQDFAFSCPIHALFQCASVSCTAKRFIQLLPVCVCFCLRPIFFCALKIVTYGDVFTTSESCSFMF